MWRNGHPERPQCRSLLSCHHPHCNVLQSQLQRVLCKGYLRRLFFSATQVVGHVRGHRLPAFFQPLESARPTGRPSATFPLLNPTRHQLTSTLSLLPPPPYTLPKLHLLPTTTTSPYTYPTLPKCAQATSSSPSSPSSSPPSQVRNRPLWPHPHPPFPSLHLNTNPFPPSLFNKQCGSNPASAQPTP